MKTRAAALILFLFGSVLVAGAGSLTISPVRVDLTEVKPNALVQVTNSADEPITVQVHAASWRNAGMDDIYGETNDVLVNPPVFTLAAGEKQLIRLALRVRERSDVERTYRLILEEVPKAPKPGTISTILRITVPVFQVPRRPVAPKLVWGAEITKEGTLRITADNKGSQHDRIRDVVIEAGGTRIEPVISAYILPGGRREFEIRNAHIQGADRIGLSAVTDSGKVHEELAPKRE